MNSASGAATVVLAIGILILAASGKFDCLIGFWDCLTGSQQVKPDAAPFLGPGTGVILDWWNKRK